MKKTKTQSGITLIALIITILVLLILAGVAIKSIQDGGLITKAEQAADKYTQAQEDELAMLDEYVGEIEKAQAQIGEVAGLNVGDFIKYGEDLYMVLHNSPEQGLQIVSTKLSNDTVTLEGLDGFENRIQIFKKACAPYINRELGAVDARISTYTFNELNNLKLLEYTLDLGSSGQRVVKVYGRSDTSDQTEVTNLTTLLTKAAQNNIFFTEDFWVTGYQTSQGKEYFVQYFDAAQQTFGSASLAQYSETDKTITETGVAKKILPVILLDSRITLKTANAAGETLDGTTPAKAYEYTFNK